MNIAGRSQESLKSLLSNIEKPRTCLVLGNDELAEFLSEYWEIEVDTNDELDFYDFIYLSDGSFFGSLQKKSNQFGVSDVYGYDINSRRDMFPLTSGSRKLFFDVLNGYLSGWEIYCWRQSNETSSEGLMVRKIPIQKIGIALLSLGDNEIKEIEKA